MSLSIRELFTLKGLRSTDGRPVVVALIDGRPRELVVDSGASEVVLYEKPSGAGAMVRLNSNGGSLRAQTSTGRFSFPGDREHIIDVVRVDVGGLGPGLLPTRAFESVFVSNREGFVQFSRRGEFLLRRTSLLKVNNKRRVYNLISAESRLKLF
jgi:hypothetical protein